MRTTVEPLEGNKVKLTVELDEGEFDRAIDDAFRRIGREVRIPGFRPGKAPRRLLEARVGLDAARQEAIRDALPDYYEKALKENDLEAIAPPEIDITAGKDAGPIAFDATVEVMPQVSVAGYGGLRVVLPSFAVSEDDVDKQVDRLRQQFGELQPTSRPARDGDHVLMDRKVYRHGETVVATDDELYEVGSALVGPELDENLRGARTGDILKFNVHHDEIGEVTFQVLVKEVRQKILPDATDEWAAEASEFETLAELRDNVREQISAVRKLEAALTVRDKVIDALVELVDEDVPEPLIGAEMERRLRLMAHRLEHQGADIAQYLASTGRSENDLLADLRAQSLGAVKADLGLRAVADAEGIEATDAELNEEVVRIAEQRKKRPTVVRRELEDEDQLPAVLSGIRK
ncbi:MAG: trigger factor, partial [Actinomycetota bacterium]|nr:trigger factor [Actinomycetota bacterium]